MPVSKKPRKHNHYPKTRSVGGVRAAMYNQGIQDRQGRRSPRYGCYPSPVHNSSKTIKLHKAYMDGYNGVRW